MRQLEIYINSYLDRLISENDSSSLQWTVLLENQKEIRIFPDEKKVSLKLGSIEIPNVLYNFGYYTSRVWFVWDVGGAGEGLHYIEINTNRVYTTPNDLVTELNSLITAHATLSDIVFSYTENERKITVTNNSAVVIKMISSYRHSETYGGTVPYNDMMDRLGFTQDLTSTNIAAGGGSLKASGLIKMLRTNCFYLACDQLGTSFHQSIIPRNGKNQKILARLATSDFGTLCQLSYPAVVDFQLLNEKSIRQLKFSLLDDEFEPVDLGQYPVTMTLIVTIE